jgi:hypothetical protein
VVEPSTWSVIAIHRSFRRVAARQQLGVDRFLPSESVRVKTIIHRFLISPCVYCTDALNFRAMSRIIAARSQGERLTVYGAGGIREGVCMPPAMSPEAGPRHHARHLMSLQSQVECRPQLLSRRTINRQWPRRNELGRQKHTGTRLSWVMSAFCWLRALMDAFAAGDSSAGRGCKIQIPVGLALLERFEPSTHAAALIASQRHGSSDQSKGAQQRQLYWPLTYSPCS